MSIRRKWLVVSLGIRGTSVVDPEIESRHFTRMGAVRARRNRYDGRHERVMATEWLGGPYAHLATRGTNRNHE